MTQNSPVASGAESAPEAASPQATAGIPCSCFLIVCRRRRITQSSLAANEQSAPASTVPSDTTSAATSASPFPAPAATVAAPVGFRTSGPWIAGALYVVVPSGPLLPIAEPDYGEDDGPTWYCITKGTFVGVTLSNALASMATVSIRASNMKGYKTQSLALAAFNDALQYPRMITVISGN
ncbi:hypothetical protein C8R43DRAFT_1128494 [Mycena crocata]|nr:hypothetical protein C8R43DRAFT_1128494 [Mycena crocata]